MGQGFQSRQCRVPSLLYQSGGNDPQQECTRSARSPNRPVPREHSSRSKQSPVDSICSNSQARKKIDHVMQREARLQRERSVLNPLPRPEKGSQRHIDERRHAYQCGKVPAGPITSSVGKAAQEVAETRGNSKKRGCDDIKQQQMPQETQLAGRPKWKRLPMRPERGPTRIN